MKHGNYSEVELKHFMHLALQEAEQAYQNGEVPVGCVLVARGSKEVLSRASNMTNATRNATRHCELVAIDAAFKSFSDEIPLFSECDMFVTCEPCIMCAAALRYVGIGGIIFGCSNDRFGGCGSVIHVDSRLCPRGAREPATYANVCAEESVLLFQKFYSRGNPRGWFDFHHEIHLHEMKQILVPIEKRHRATQAALLQG